MAISIDWGQKIINVPKADLTLVQSSPTEIRELDINSFRLSLRDLEDDDAGMNFDSTHTHNTTVNVGGVSLARVIQIINSYTITFEDGQYAVNLVGANSNVGDVVNVNQVSVRASNSAGLVSLPDVEFSTFEGGVWIDVNATTTGTAHPAGTRRAPVNNLADARLIADFRGLKQYFISGTIVITGNHDNFTFKGSGGILKDTIVFSGSPSIDGARIVEVTVTGSVDAASEYQMEDCFITNLTNINGLLLDCAIDGANTMSAGAVTLLSKNLSATQSASLDLNGALGTFQTTLIGSTLTLTNGGSGTVSSVGLSNGATIIIDASNGAGSIFSVTGDGTITNNSLSAFVQNSAVSHTEMLSLARLIPASL